MTSSIPPPRSDLGLLSPIAQRIASSRLDLPQPLGPTTPVRPGSMRSSAGSTKLLNPVSLSRRMLQCPPSLNAASRARRLPSRGSSDGQSASVFRAVDEECRGSGHARPFAVSVDLPSRMQPPRVGETLVDAAAGLPTRRRSAGFRSPQRTPLHLAVISGAGLIRVALLVERVLHAACADVEIVRYRKEQTVRRRTRQQASSQCPARDQDVGPEFVADACRSSHIPRPAAQLRFPRNGGNAGTPASHIRPASAARSVGPCETRPAGVARPPCATSRALARGLVLGLAAGAAAASSNAAAPINGLPRSFYGRLKLRLERRPSRRVLQQLPIEDERRRPLESGYLLLTSPVSCTSLFDHLLVAPGTGCSWPGQRRARRPSPAGPSMLAIGTNYLLDRHVLDFRHLVLRLCFDLAQPAPPDRGTAPRASGKKVFGAVAARDRFAAMSIGPWMM